MKQPKKIIAVDIGATYIRTSLFLGDTLLKYSKSETPSKGISGNAISLKIIEMIYSEILNEDTESVSSICISSAGPLDVEKGEISNSPNMSFKQVELKSPLEKEFKIQTNLINDCHAGVLGELSSDKNLQNKDFVYVTFSSGIGAGAYINNRLINGKGGNAGEFGHIFVDSTYLLPCRCGGFGHWEAYSSGTGIPSFFREFCRKNKCPLPQGDILTPDEILKNCVKGKKIYSEFAEELAVINSRGISGIIAAYSPEIIILDGSVALNNCDLITDGIYRYTDQYLEMPKIKVSRLNGLAPLYGAAYYAGHFAGKSI